MHFDEVYHARTATEFLQDWRYGMSTTSTSGPTPTSPSTRWPAGSSPGATTGSPPRRTSACPWSTRRSSRDATTRPWAATRAATGWTSSTGSEVRSYDLSTRKLIATIPLPGARAIAMDEDGLRLVVGSRRRLDLDDRRDGARHGQRRRQRRAAAARVASARSTARSAGCSSRRPAARCSSRPSDDRVITLDATTGRGPRHGPAQGGRRPRARRHGSASSTRRPDAVADPKAAASALASIVGGDATTYEDRLRSGGRHHDGRPDRRPRTSGRRSRRRSTTGALAGLTIESLPQVAVADANGRRADRSDDRRPDLDGRRRRRRPTASPSTTVDDAKLYVATDPDPATGAPGRIAIVAVGGDTAKNGPSLHRVDGDAGPGDPGRLRRRDRDGPRPRPDARTASPRRSTSSSRTPDCGLRRRPPAVRAVGLGRWTPPGRTRPTTASRSSPSTPTGEVASVDVGAARVRLAAARRPGRGRDGRLPLPARPDPVPAPAPSASSSRSSALVDGMFFVQSRIGMNDAYVGLGIVAAYTLFAALWTGRLAASRRVLDRDARSSARSWASGSPRSGSRSTRSAGSPC